MDETAYQSARGEINRLPCVFEKALLSRCVVCELSVRHLLAERETVACTEPLARAVCGQLSGLLREKSTFALKLTDTARILPHAMMMKVQCGGLNGLKDVLDPEAPGARRAAPVAPGPGRIRLARGACRFRGSSRASRTGRGASAPSRDVRRMATDGAGPPRSPDRHRAAQLPRHRRAPCARHDAVHLPARNARVLPLGAWHCRWARHRRAARSGRGCRRARRCGKRWRMPISRIFLSMAAMSIPSLSPPSIGACCPKA